MAERPLKDRLPPRPSSHADRDFENDANSPDYYLKVQVTAALEKYKGRGRGLKVFLSDNELVRLNEVKEIFGRGFELNNFICAADYFLTKDAAQGNLDCRRVDEDSGNVLQLKPNTDSMLAILRHGKENSATFLLKLGIELLSLHLSRGG